MNTNQNETNSKWTGLALAGIISPASASRFEQWIQASWRSPATQLLK